MTLTDSHLKMIADKGRALPDHVLAPLVLNVVLGTSDAATPTPAVRNPVRPRRYVKLSDRIDSLVAFLESRPGASMHDIVSALDLKRPHAHLVTTRAIQDGRVEQRGTHNRRTYHATQPETNALKPAVLLAEQRIDGENKQTLVRVVRRKAIALDGPPKNAQERRVAVVEYVRRNPGASLTDIAAALGCDKSHAQYAIGGAKQAGEIRMEGELGKARYYPRRYINGASAQQPATVGT